MSFSSYLEQALLNHVLRNTGHTSPAAVYASLHTADPTEAGTVGEVDPDTTSYARTAVTFGEPAADEGEGETGYICANSAPVEYPESEEGWGTLTHFGLWDHATAGNCLYTGAITPNQTISAGNQFVFKTGQLTVKHD